jgi:polysaccharide pyruvyl transferase WcaK-like protein
MSNLEIIVQNFRFHIILSVIFFIILVDKNIMPVKKTVLVSETSVTPKKTRQTKKVVEQKIGGVDAISSSSFSVHT